MQLGKIKVNIILQSVFLTVEIALVELQSGNLNIQFHLFLDERISCCQCLYLTKGQDQLVNILGGTAPGDLLVIIC